MEMELKLNELWKNEQTETFYIRFEILKSYRPNWFKLLQID